MLYTSDRAKASGQFMSRQEFYSEILSELKAVVEIYPLKTFYLIGTPYRVNNVHYDCFFVQNSQNPLTRLIFSDHKCPITTVPDMSDVSEVNQRLQQFADEHSNVVFIDPNVNLCQGDGRCLVSDEGCLIFADGSHFSIHGAEIVGPYILSIVFKDGIPGQQMPISNIE